MADSDPRRLVVGVSGASGAAYGVRVLDACRDLGVESHLVASRAAALTLKQETGLTLADLAGRTATGVRGMSLKDGQKVIALIIASTGTVLLGCARRSRPIPTSMSSWSPTTGPSVTFNGTEC